MTFPSSYKYSREWKPVTQGAKGLTRCLLLKYAAWRAIPLVAGISMTSGAACELGSLSNCVFAVFCVSTKEGSSATLHAWSAHVWVLVYNEFGTNESLLQQVFKPALNAPIGAWKRLDMQTIWVYWSRKCNPHGLGANSCHLLEVVNWEVVINRNRKLSFVGSIVDFTGRNMSSRLWTQTRGERQCIIRSLKFTLLSSLQNLEP
jgi:hypothetical protein